MGTASSFRRLFLSNVTSWTKLQPLVNFVKRQESDKYLGYWGEGHQKGNWRNLAGILHIHTQLAQLIHGRSTQFQQTFLSHSRLALTFPPNSGSSTRGLLEAT